MPTRRATSKPVYRIRNWKKSNAALVDRGSLTLWVDREALESWQYQGPPHQGAQFRLSKGVRNRKYVQ